MKLWAGRFTEKTSHLLDAFNESISFDQALYREDIEGSMAHGKMLHKMGLLTGDELAQILKGLSSILTCIESGKATLTIENEDIHMNVEALLVEAIGPLGKKLHTARSRNDQVALDVKLYTIKATKNILHEMNELLAVLLDLSDAHMDYIMPGYTHLQAAQPIRLSFHLMAYFEMFKRDHKRFSILLDQMDELPLGAGAFSGVNYETDRAYLADLLGFSRITENAMDTVSDRDFLIEFQSHASIVMMHLSRFCEELIIWSSQAYSFVEMSDAFTTGSSIMPQKKNPDAAELIRGKTGRVFGNLMGLLTVMKGLPLAYNKDMQEDKEGLFDTVKTLSQALPVFTNMLKTTTFNKLKMAQAAQHGFLNATDLADYLVKKGLSFRDCHEIAGKITRYCIEHQTVIESLPLDTLKNFCPLFNEDVYSAISLESVIESKKSYGSTRRSAVLHAISQGRKYLESKQS